MKLKTEIYIYIYLGSKIQEYTEWNPGSGINPEPGRESTYPRCSVSICLYLYSPGGGNVMCVCLYQKSVCKVTVPVCKAVRLAFSCQTSAISFPFIPIPGTPLFNLILPGYICYIKRAGSTVHLVVQTGEYA